MNNELREKGFYIVGFESDENKLKIVDYLGSQGFKWRGGDYMLRFGTVDIDDLGYDPSEGCVSKRWAKPMHGIPSYTDLEFIQKFIDAKKQTPREERIRQLEAELEELKSRRVFVPEDKQVVVCHIKPYSMDIVGTSGNKSDSQLNLVEPTRERAEALRDTIAPVVLLKKFQLELYGETWEPGVEDAYKLLRAYGKYLSVRISSQEYAAPGVVFFKTHEDAAQAAQFLNSKCIPSGRLTQSDPQENPF